MTKYPINSRLKEEGFTLSYSLRAYSPPAWQMAPWCQECESWEGWGRPLTPQGPPSVTHSSSKTLLPKVSMALPTEEQVFKHMDL